MYQVRRGTGASSLAEYWPSATTRENLEVPGCEYWPAASTRENLEVPPDEDELRESVDSNNYWVPSDNQSNYDKMG